MSDILLFIKTQWAAIKRSESGIAFIEFAICAPLLFILIFGVIDITRMMLIVQKMDQAAGMINKVVAQTDPSISGFDSAMFSTSMTSLMGALGNLMNPYAAEGSIKVYVSYVTEGTGNPLPVPQVAWQSCSGSLTGASSKIGSTGGNATLTSVPGGYTMAASEETVITEFYYAFRPILAHVIPPVALYRVVVSPPHFGSLAAYVPNPSGC